jgi:polysaccharide pyruvyl transferase WcaK-like protein
VKGPVRRVALYGYLGSSNLGNDASLETVVSWFEAHHPKIDLRCITIAPEQVEKQYGIASVPLAWRSPRRARSRTTETLQNLLGRLLDVPRSYRLAGSVDAVIVPGMGVLEDSLTARPWALPYWLFLIALACRIRGRRFVLLDVGAERAANPVTRWLFAATARLATHASFRDRSSAAVMARAGIRGRHVVAPDLAFAHPASTVAEPIGGRVVVGVMAYHGPGDDPRRGAAVRRHYVATLADALTTLAGSGQRITLVGGDQVDIDVARAVRAAVLRLGPDLPGDAVVIREVTTFAELTCEMRSAEVVVASRFHNVICALRLGRPTVAVGYADKCRNLMDALGLDDYHQHIDQLDAGRLIAQVRAAQRDAEALAAHIRAAGSHYGGEVESLLRRVTREELGLDAHQPQQLAVSDGTGVWRAD